MQRCCYVLVVLVGNPLSVLSQVLEGIPPALRTNLDKVAFVLLAAPVVQRLAECQGGTCGYQ